MTLLLRAIAPARAMRRWTTVKAPNGGAAGGRHGLDSRTGIRAAAEPRPAVEQTLFRSNAGAKSPDVSRKSNNSVTRAATFNIYVGYIGRVCARRASDDPRGALEAVPPGSRHHTIIQICRRDRGE
jgi:hypothetical protein